MSASFSAVEQANTLLATGAAADAVRVLTAATQRDDPDALNTLALWHVYGHPVPRNFATARTLFERAGAAGHAEGARTHAVFVAIGAGGSADWPAALALLERGAANDPLAARQLDLIAAMSLKSDGMPVSVPAIKSLSASPRLGQVRSLFTREECAHMINLSAPRLTASVVVDPTTGKQAPHPIRTSDGTVLGPIQEDVVIHALNLRIAAITGTREEQGEPLAVLRYAPGQQYRLHHDCLPGEPNQRSLTLIAYLNDGYGEGATRFPTINTDIQGQTGDAIIFGNVLPDGRVDERSRHAGLPVKSGEKWICTRWIRQANFDPWGMRERVATVGD